MSTPAKAGVISHELILGGARSGKSAYAEWRASQAASVCYIATAQAGDDEMSDRILKHRRQRPSHWQTLEQPIALAEAIQQGAEHSELVLIDCLTLWLSNCLLCGEETWQQQRTRLLEQLQCQTIPVLMVSNEVGQGVVPMGELSRRFVDESGRLHQAIAAQVHHVTLVTAGLPQALKRHGQLTFPPYGVTP
jgi:adenosylcobinamide kinase/adenosylcobinamide-phosphate guanylyltransferase